MTKFWLIGFLRDGKIQPCSDFAGRNCISEGPQAVSYGSCILHAPLALAYPTMVAFIVGNKTSLGPCRLGPGCGVTPAMGETWGTAYSFHFHPEQIQPCSTLGAKNIFISKVYAKTPEKEMLTVLLLSQGAQYVI